MSKSGKIWQDGRILAADEAGLNPADRGFLLGDGLFETLLARRGHVFALARHLDRLARSAAELEIPLPYEPSEMAAALPRLLAANDLQASEAAIRITLSRGIGARGLLPPPSPQPHLTITAVAYESPPPEASLIAAMVDLRRNETSPLSRLKTLSYLDQILAQQAAQHLCGGEAAEALQLNMAGRVAGFARGNLFALIADRLLTPPLGEGVLPGIAREGVKAAALALGLAIGETPLAPADLTKARAIYFTNSLLGPRAIRRLDGRDFAPCAETDALRQAYEAWLTA